MSIPRLHVCYANFSHSSSIWRASHRGIFMNPMIQFFPHPFFPVIFFYPFPQLATMSISWRSPFAKQTFLLVISLAGFTYFPGTFRVLFSLSICVLGTQFYFPVRHWCIERCSWHTFALGAFSNHSLQCCFPLTIIACIHYADISWYVTSPQISGWKGHMFSYVVN